MVAVRGDIIPLLTDEGPEWWCPPTLPAQRLLLLPNALLLLLLQQLAQSAGRHYQTLMPRWVVAANFCPCTAVHKQAWPRLIDKKTLIFTKDFAETFRKKLN